MTKSDVAKELNDLLHPRLTRMELVYAAAACGEKAARFAKEAQEGRADLQQVTQASANYLYDLQTKLKDAADQEMFVPETGTNMHEYQPGFEGDCTECGEGMDDFTHGPGDQ